MNYISDKYAGFKNIRSLLNDMGVHHFFWKEDIPLLKHKKFAVYFWNKYLGDAEARSKIEEWIKEGEFKNIKCVPTANGVKSAEELYNTFGTFAKTDLTSYVNLLKDGGELCAENIVESFQDKCDEKILYPNPIGNLDFICILSKEHCFEYLMNCKVENTAKRRFVLAQLLDYQQNGQLSDEDIESYRKSEHAKWLNGKKESAHISTLFAIGRQAEDKYYLRHFGNSSFVISHDTIADDDTSFETICLNILKIKVLHGGEESDFVTRPSSDSFDETEQIRHILNQKSLLLSTIINAPEGEDWKTSYDKYVSEIAKLKFVKCSSISIECKENTEISKSDVDAFFYDKATKTFYYLKDWQHKFVFDSMWRKLIEVLSIPGSDDEMTIKKILDKDLESRDVDHLIEEYCTNFYDDEAFIDLLSHLYPDTSIRLNIEPSPIEVEVKPQKLVAFSYDRDNAVTDTHQIDNEVVNNTNGVYKERKDDELIPSTEESSIIEKSDTPVKNESCYAKVQVSNDEEDSLVGNVIEQAYLNNQCENSHIIVSTAEDVDMVDSMQEQTILPVSDAMPNTTTSHTIDSVTGKSDISEFENFDIVDAREEYEYYFDPDHGERIGSIENDKSYQLLGDRPRKPRSVRRTAKPFTKEEINSLRSNGTPLELESLPPTKEELDVLAQCGISPEQIADTNYLAQLRLYRNLQHELHEDPEESLADFIRNANDVSEHKMKSGKYIHACSAARGVMYISPSVWNKMLDDKWVICVYLDGKGKNFHYINSSKEFLQLVQKDDVVIKITGKEKLEVINSLYSGMLEDVKGTAYTLIRVASRTNMDAVFAHYVGAMAESEDGNDDTSEF